MNNREEPSIQQRVASLQLRQHDPLTYQRQIRSFPVSLR